MQIKNTSKGKMGFDFSTDMEYTVCGDGSILVNSIIIPSVNGEIIPRIGYKMILPEGFERMHWYGRGPLENYSDRKDASFVGFYDDLVSNQRVDYLTPQEMGGHEDVRWIAVTNSDGLGFAFVAGDNMAASALHITHRIW